jgi:hypothetical protein
MKILGVDSGSSGALALLDFVGDDIRVNYTTVPRAGSEIDTLALRKWIVDNTSGPFVAYLEEYLKGRRVRNAMKLAYNVGQEYAVIRSVPNNVEVRLINPVSWQSALLSKIDVSPDLMKEGVAEGRHNNMAKSKLKSTLFAKSFFPEINFVYGRRTTPNHGIADAICIALFGAQEQGLIEIEGVYDEKAYTEEYGQLPV